MSVPDADPMIVRKWVMKAENDLQTAVLALPLRNEAPTDTICFHAQQCIEKYLKAVLILKGISFPKTHDLFTITELIPEDLRPAIDKSVQERMTDYATVARYPDKEPDPSLAEARKAVAIARRIRKEVRRVLPRAALRRMKK